MGLWGGCSAHHACACCLIVQGLLESRGSRACAPAASLLPHSLDAVPLVLAPSLTCNCQRPGGRRLQGAQATLPSSTDALRQQDRTLSATPAEAAADAVFTLTSPRVFLTASELTMYSVSPLVQLYTTKGGAGVYAIGAAPHWVGMRLWRGN